MALQLLAFIQRNTVKKTLRDIHSRLYRCAYAICLDTGIAQHSVRITESRALDRRPISNAEDGELGIQRILINSCRECLTLPGTTMATQDDDHPDELSRHRLIEQRRLAIVRQAIARLPFEQRCVLVLVDLENYSYKQISQILGISIDTVLNRLTDARRVLLAELTAKLNRSMPWQTAVSSRDSLNVMYR